MFAKRHRITVLSALLSSAAACTDMSTPAELSHAQIIAVRADPPVVEPAGSAALSVLVAGPEGVVQPAAVSWGENVVLDGKGQPRFVAPAAVSADGDLVRVDVEILLADGTALLASKSVGVGVALPDANPEIVELRVGGALIRGGALALARDEAVALDLAVSPSPSQASIYAWYSTAGEIELYRRSPTEILTGDEATTGALIAVYRDGLGVAWRVLAVEVD